MGVVLDRLILPSLPTLQGEHVVLRGHLESDVDDRLRHPIDPEEEDGYGSSWRREWDGRRYHPREHLTRDHGPLDPSVCTWTFEHDSHCIGSARLRVDPDQHCATYSVGLFVAGLRGRGLGREITGLVLSWAFSVLGAHRRTGSAGQQQPRGLYPDGWKDFILMGVLQSEYLSQPKTARAAESGTRKVPSIATARAMPGRCAASSPP